MNPMIVAGAAAGGLVAWYAVRRSMVVPCELDLEATQEHFHAHAVLEGTEVNEGDEVLLHHAPDRIPLGEVRRVSTSATVTHVSYPRRMLARVLGTSGITELYDVGFEG